MFDKLLENKERELKEAALRREESVNEQAEAQYRKTLDRYVEGYLRYADDPAKMEGTIVDFCYTWDFGVKQEVIEKLNDNAELPHVFWGINNYKGNAIEVYGLREDHETLL